MLFRGVAAVAGAAAKACPSKNKTRQKQKKQQQRQQQKATEKAVLLLRYLTVNMSRCLYYLVGNTLIMTMATYPIL